MLDPSDLIGIDEVLAWRIIAVARSIASGLDALEDGPARTSAIAILVGVAREAQARGSRQVAGQRMGPASVNYQPDVSWFSTEDRDALRAACGPAPAAGGPIGRFPKSTVVTRLWPEEQEGP
ncbi:hypothetical protein E3O55_08475 [Cryobacterium sp. MDB1-18-2]|uniref:hypothetical protein n=1 Tax=unclassified Cryobacterium TaxID=2649013 RepID=UPI00106A36F7|nr:MULTISPECIES: hypothetical protein [unclassified Cryobacterium]TFC30108.1 hypothetical protein E3O55_08475 [Cryobacterium sp. MDB1-18-2]TFC41388.1 hypothetical protein E3O50_09915 [Cryobacterium sp. MDB1-18-1]